MSFRETQFGENEPVNEFHFRVRQVIEAVIHGKLSLDKIKAFRDKCLFLGIKNFENIIDIRREVDIAIMALERREIMAERNMLEKEGKLVELEKRLSPSAPQATYGKLASVTPLFKKEKIKTIVEPAVIAQSVEKPRNHLRLIK